MHSTTGARNVPFSLGSMNSTSSGSVETSQALRVSTALWKEQGWSCLGPLDAVRIAKQRFRKSHNAGGNDEAHIDAGTGSGGVGGRLWGQHLLQPGEPKIARYVAGTPFPIRYGESVRVEDSSGKWLCTIRLDSIWDWRPRWEECERIYCFFPADACKAHVYFTVVTAQDTISTKLAVPGCGPFREMPSWWGCTVCEWENPVWGGKQRQDTLGLRLCLLWVAPHPDTSSTIRLQAYEATLCVQQW